ncbi:unnamed protein product, partial [marine sediment metagenome]
NERTDILLVVNRAIDMNVNQYDDNYMLCQNILNILSDTCLSIDPLVSTNVAFNQKYGIVPEPNIDPLLTQWIGKNNIKSPYFKRLVIAKPNMVKFFTEANLGPSDPNDPNSTPLNKMLSVGINGVTTRGMMTYIFGLYTHVNKMQQDPNAKQFLTATPLMYKYFKNTFDMLAARPQTFNKKGKPIPIFDPTYFRYAALQSIIQDNLYKKNELNNEQRTLTGNFIKDYRGLDIATVEQKRISNEMKQRIELEEELVSGVSKIIRDRKKAGL